MKACLKEKKVSRKTKEDARKKGKIVKPVLTKISRETAKLLGQQNSVL